MSSTERRFTSPGELGMYLAELDPDYEVYAAALYQAGVRRISQLAHAQQSDLEAHGVPAIHASDIKARAGVEPEPATQFPATPRELRALMQHARKYTADILDAKGHKQAATVVRDDIIVTYQHTDHESWAPGQRVTVYVGSDVAGQRQAVVTTVVTVHKKADIIVLKVDPTTTQGYSKVEGAVHGAPDISVYPGQPYMLSGQSTQVQADLTSTAHGSIAAVEMDEWYHIRGDSQSGQGDSGGGVFAVESGQLLGVCVGNDDRTKKSIIVPTAVLMTILGV